MNNTYMKWLNKGVLGAVIIAGCSACTDTWDDHYGPGANNATKTLWEQIKENDKLTNFARILEMNHYSKSQGNKSKTLTYKDLLNTDQVFTIWAPEDGSYNADSIIALGDDYNVEKEFIRNHLTRFSRPLSDNQTDSITMYNQKVNLFEKGNKTFKGINIVEANIPAKNGVLHTIAAPVAFQDNLFEYLDKAENIDSLKTFFHSMDTTYFDEYNSVKGPIVNGKPTYIDSVFFYGNMLLNFRTDVNGNPLYGMGARMESEDSLYAFIMPTNEAWKQGIAKIDKLNTYRKSYIRKNSKGEVEKETKVNPDSMKYMQTRLGLVTPLAFNMRHQPGGIMTPENPGGLDSLITTNDLIIQAPNCKEIFDNVQPIKLSNGYAYPVNNFNYLLKYTVMKNIEIEAEYSFNHYGDPTGATYERIRVTALDQNPTVSGWISNGYYIRLRATAASSHPALAFRADAVRSGKYDIYAVMVPSHITSTDTVSLPYKFNAKIEYYDSPTKTTLASKTVRNLKSDPTKVDSVLLWEDFEFPISYAGVDDQFPIITLTDVVNSSENEKTHSRNMCIDRIILISKED